MVQKFVKPVEVIFILVFAILLLSLLSCAGTQISWMRSSTTKRVKKAPYYDGKVNTISNRIGHLPITFDNRLQKAWVGMNRGQFMLPISEEMNTFLDDLNITTKLSEIDLPISEAPDIYVGDASAFGAPTSPIDIDNDENPRSMIIYKSDPSKSWREKLSQVSATGDVDYVLFITIGFSDFFLRQKNILGSKVLELGTNYTLQINWFSDLDTPAEVFYVTGALLNKEGKIIRAGAEGIIAKKTGFFTSVFDLQDVLSEEDLQKLLKDERREDLPGQPLKWKVALQNLVAQLLNRDDLIN
jgi:hypothetical protein